MKDLARFTTMSSEEVLGTYGTSPEEGLSTKAVLEHRRESGLNAVAHDRNKVGRILARQFSSAFVYLLVAAAVIALVLGEPVDAAFIVAFIVINTSLGFYQEFHSEQTLRLLGRFLVARVRVRRGGEDVVVESAELVPGDLVRIETGDVVQADMRVIAAHGLQIDESPLTGETTPITKSADALASAAGDVYRAVNIAFSGTHVVSGSAEAVVVETGARTMVGETAKLTSETVRESTFEKSLSRFSGFILRLVALTMVAVFLVQVALRGGNADMGELLIFSIALAVSVVPEALPTVMTFSLSRGALYLSRKKVVVRRLSAIEDLGGVEILCSDKTGTLTEGRLSVGQIHAHDAEIALRRAVAECAGTKDASKIKDPFDLAVWQKLNEADRRALMSWKRLADIPFDPFRRRSSVLVQTGRGAELMVRGAAESVLVGCDLPKKERDEALDWAAEQGTHGRRVLAIASKRLVADASYDVKEEAHGLTLNGLIAFSDPIKASTTEAVRKAERLGVRIKILTGDSPEVAGAVAFEVGLVKDAKQVLTGEAFDALPTHARHEAVQAYDVFARVSPEQKYRIIQLLQEKNEVGFLGEGINDAPALKIANVAIVVHGAADVAREAADIVLLQQTLGVIVDGIQEGRKVFANSIKYIQATLASNFGNFYALAFATIFIPYLPMLPLQILLLNLLSDFPMISIAADRVDAGELQRPRRYDITQIALFATVIGLVSTAFDFLFFALYMHADPAVLHTNWFIGSVLTELALIFSIRTRRLFFRGAPPAGILLALTGIGTFVALILPFTAVGIGRLGFHPPTVMQMGAILGIVVLYFAATECVKHIYYRFVPESA